MLQTIDFMTLLKLLIFIVAVIALILVIVYLTRNPKVQERVKEGVRRLTMTMMPSKVNNSATMFVDPQKIDKKEYFKISIAHPKLLAKRFASPFLIQLFSKKFTLDAKAKISTNIGEDNIDEHVYDSEFKFRQLIKIELYSPDISFSDPITKKLDSPLNSVSILGKPLDTCEPGEHKVVLSIIDKRTGIEYQSETFSVKVVDFAFGRVSRPFLSNVSAIGLSIGSFTMFILAFLEQIDKTIGLTSGTAAGVLAAVVYNNFYNLYHRIRLNRRLSDEDYRIPTKLLD